MDFTIANRLVELRRAHGYTQESLAERLGLTRQAVSRWERGESLPDTENLIALAGLYDVSLDDLIRTQAQEEPADTDTGAGDSSMGEEPLDSEAHEASPHADDTPVVPPMVLNTGQPLILEDRVRTADTVPRVVGTPVDPAAPRLDEQIVFADSASPASHQTPGKLHVPESAQEAKALGNNRRNGSLVALLVVACLSVALLLGWLVLGAVNYLSFQPPSEVVEMGSVAANTEMLDPQQVHDVRISWGLGPVVIKAVDPGETDGAILVEEEYLDSSLEDYPMERHLSNGELSIAYGVDSLVSIGRRGKRLTILVPNDAGPMGDIRCETASGELELRDLACASLHVQVSSGDATVEGVVADRLDLQVSSGEAEVDGSIAQSAVINLGSGEAQVSTSVVPRDTRIEVASGDATLLLPGDAEFTVRATTASGDFDLGFDARKEGSSYTVGRGENTIDVSVASGEVRIDKR